MILVVGLGNPGKKFEKTRHNVGFRVVDKIATNFQFSIFNFQSPKEKLRFPTGQAIFNAKISKGKIGSGSIILVKPQTFMNNSGKSVKLLTKPYTLNPNNLIIVHDDIDLNLGKIKIVKNRGAAGHKGVQSIIDELGNKNFVRFRIGINPKPYTLNPKTLDKFVLQKFNKKEEKILKEVIKKTCQAIEMAIKEGVEKAMQKYNIMQIYE